MSLTITGSITRTELALADLAFEVEGTYKITELGPGAQTWRREVATSSYVHGETLMGAVKDVRARNLGVRVYATSAAVLATRVDDLLKAFEQFTYNLTVTLDGVTMTWTCEPADYAVGDGGTFDKYSWMARQQEVRLTVPSNPIPVAGVF